MIECKPSMWEALGLDPSTKQKTKQKTQEHQTSLRERQTVAHSTGNFMDSELDLS